MLLIKLRMVWSAKCLEPQSKTLFRAIVLFCTHPEAGNYEKAEKCKENASCTQLCYWGKMRLHPAESEKPYGTRLFNA